MTEFRAIHDDTPKIVAIKKQFNRALEQIRFQLWKKSEKIARLERRIKELSKEA